MGVVGKFVEYFGEGCKDLTLGDRASLSNMAPEYGATIGFFPVDATAIDYLRLTGREKEKIELIEKYLKENMLFREYDERDKLINYSGEVIKLDLADVKPCLAGPKRPHDRVELCKVKEDFN